ASSARTTLDHVPVGILASPPPCPTHESDPHCNQAAVETANRSFSGRILYVDRSPRLNCVVKSQALNSRRTMELFGRHFMARCWLEKIAGEIVAQREAEENQ